MQETKNTLGCTSWNHPHATTSERLCTQDLVTAFKHNMTTEYHSKHCADACLPDCRGVSYEAKKSTFVVDSARECSTLEIQTLADFSSVQHR